MKFPARLLFALAATCLAFATSASAQLQTFNTYAGFSGSTITFGTNGSLYQTFSNVSAVQTMTFNFFTTSSNTGTTFTATFGQWNGSSFVGGTTISLPGFTTTDSTTWGTQTIGSFTGKTYQVALDLSSVSSLLTNPTYGYTTNSANTYAMLLTDTSGGGASIGLGLNTTDPINTGSFGFSGGTVFGTSDWVFSSLSVVPGNVALVPESSTVAGIAGAVLVAGLVVLRLRQRRQPVSAPVPAN